MVTSKLAITEFLQRSLRDLSRLKELPSRQLNRELKERCAEWCTAPRRHQKVALLAGLRLKSLYLMMDPGTGKTWVALSIFLSRLAVGRAKRMLVLVPALVNIEAWREQLAEHAPHLVFGGLDSGTREEKFELLRDESVQVVCVTYQGWLMLTHARQKKRSKKKRGLKRDDSLHDELAQLFDMVVWDEVTFIKGHDSLSFRSARRMAKLVPYRYALSGTPMDKNPSDLWAQFYALDRGDTLGPTLGLYRSAFFSEVEDYWGHISYEFQTSKKKELRRRLRNRALTYRDYECLDLPPLVGGLLSKRFMVCTVRWPEQNWNYYQKLLAQLGEERSEAKRENTYIRMRQVCSGFLPVAEEDGQQQVVWFNNNPKLDALLALLSELPQNRKVIVYNEFQHSGKLIEERLAKEKIPALRLYGLTKDKKGTLRRFKQDPAVRVLVGSESVAYGLNLQVANYIVMYESPDSTIPREQVERRIYRQGQTEHCYFWDLAVQNSVEVRILKALREGRNLREEILASNDPRSLL